MQKTKKATVTWDQDEKVFDCDGTESNLWKNVGEVLLNIEIPNQIDVEFDGKRIEKQ